MSHEFNDIFKDQYLSQNIELKLVFVYIYQFPRFFFENAVKKTTYIHE